MLNYFKIKFLKVKFQMILCVVERKDKWSSPSINNGRCLTAAVARTYPNHH